MQRRHFELIAQTLKAERTMFPDEFRTHDQIAHAFARKLAGENPRFDRDRFLTACGA